MLLSGAVAAASSSQTLKRTPLFDRHVDAGAKLVPFAGWEMPVQYGGIREEHVAVRDACGVFDVSHMGEIETSGPQAQELLQRLRLQRRREARGGRRAVRASCAARTAACSTTSSPTAWRPTAS